MFEIEYKGANTVVIATKGTKLVADPKLSVVGLKDYSVKNSVELATEERFALGESDSLLYVDGPGEYEVGDFSIRGVASNRHIDFETDKKLSTIYRIEVGETRIALLGNIDSKLSDAQLEAIGIVDILILPIGGGGYTLDATSASGIIRAIDPKVVIPTHYYDKDLKYEVPQDTFETFVKEIAAPVESVGSKYKVKSAAAIPQTLTIVKIDRN